MTFTGPLCALCGLHPDQHPHPFCQTAWVSPPFDPLYSKAVVDGLEAQLNEANATIATLREALEWFVEIETDDCRWDHDDGYCQNHNLSEAPCYVAEARKLIAQPLPPSAAKLLAERDAGRALFEACTAPYEKRIMSDTVWQAVEAYRKVVEG